MNINKAKKLLGFTLIELIIVIGILSILSVAILVMLNPVTQFQKANDSRRKSDLSQIQKALEIYYQDNKQYPQSTSSYLIQSFDPNQQAYTAINWGNAWKPYMNLLPKDPKSTNKYIYYSSDGQSYYLYANLERGVKDPQVCNGALECSNVPTGASCGGVCNYGITSPDTSP